MKTTYEEMLNYLKALDEEEEVYFLGDDCHPMAGGRLMSVASDGMRAYGTLGGDGVIKISLTDESYELMKKQNDNNEISLEELCALYRDEFFEFIAYKKGCLPNKEYYCMFSEREYDYHRKNTRELEMLLKEINVYNTYEEAFQELGAHAEEGYLHEWSDVDGYQIRECYDAAVNYKNIVSRNK